MKEKENVVILAIESSCDETAAAVVVNGREVLSNTIFTQIDLHKVYGGVVPEIASRKHIEKINQVIEEALLEAGKTLDEIDAVAVTYGPGLVGALLVGVAEAKAIAYAKKLPLVGVHHIEGHIAANFIEHKELKPPFVCLVVSGGHTHLVRVVDYGEFEILGRTRDDAAGEAFDKVARAIGIGYPGGPKIDKLSKEGDENAIKFPKAHIEGAPYDFSFSGVKSAVLNYLNGCQMRGEEYCTADVAASFQKAVVDVLVENAMKAIDEFEVKQFAIAGGVASNSSLRSAMERACKEKGVAFYCPSPVYCTDNAAMIGVAGYYEYQKGVRHSWDLNAVPNLKLGEK
ncbi:tRNA (adenosine(37)-N6)-threonylcarbamoyltransferase complex transferase subunit TsaD [Lachnospiraceae bacterium OttesenSCG-928-E19]|nr:tRNA (adenosine(37)-N6)-threonylcarbamoyltransferase complex transferase subunit TsaD [Lachnospiraceae bacterium OttesenSCG-928-E19]